MAAAIFGAGAAAIRAELRGYQRQARKQKPPVPTLDDIWNALDDGQRTEFVRRHTASVWSAVEQVTA